MAKPKRVLLFAAGSMLAYAGLRIIRTKRADGSLNPDRLAAELPDRVARRLTWLPAVARQQAAQQQADAQAEQDLAARRRSVQDVWDKNKGKQAGTVPPPSDEPAGQEPAPDDPTMHRGEKLG